MADEPSSPDLHLPPLAARGRRHRAPARARPPGPCRVRQRPRAPLRPSAPSIAARGFDLDAADAAVGDPMGFRNRSRRIFDEQGIALPLALAVLAVIGVLGL